MHAGVDASLTESVDAECVKGVDAEHIHAGLRAGYRHRAHAGYRHRAHGSSSLAPHDTCFVLVASRHFDIFCSLPLTMQYNLPGHIALPHVTSNILLYTSPCVTSHPFVFTSNHVTSNILPGLCLTSQCIPFMRVVTIVSLPFLVISSLKSHHLF